MKKPWKQSPEDCVSRVRCMVDDNGGTWDLSENDKEALQHVLAELTALRSENERMRGVAKEAYIEGWIGGDSDGRLYPDVCRRSAEQEWEASDARAALDSTTTKGAE